jgi:hypothetical protein
LSLATSKVGGVGLGTHSPVHFNIYKGDEMSATEITRYVKEKATQNNTYITRHAKEKFRKLARFEGTDNEILTKLIYLMDNAETFEPDPEFKVKSLIRHHFRKTEYFLSDGFVMVVVLGNLATVFKHSSNDRMWKAY